MMAYRSFEITSAIDQSEESSTEPKPMLSPASSLQGICPLDRTYSVLRISQFKNV